ncbi:MAG: TlpA family protein disulfide reductase, partial [Bradyrhizobium sp.]
MLSRRSVLLASLVATTIGLVPALAVEEPAFDANAFAQDQKAGKPILIAIHASWCPTCKAQKPILHALRADPKFKNLVYS